MGPLLVPCRMIIVAEDAVEVQPLEVGRFQINNGQRELPRQH